MLEKTKNQIKLIAIILIICLTAPNLLLCIPSNAETSEYSLTDATVTLDGENDATVEIELLTATGGTFYALQAIWDLNDNETGSYFTLSDLEAAGSVSAMENDPATGYIVWTDASYTGFDVDAGGTIWTATYTIDKDTPSGTYTVDCYLISVTGGRNEYDSEDPFETLTATITVEREDDEGESEEETENVFTATFDTDDGVSSIDIYYTQDYETDSTIEADETDVTVAYARDGSTGETLTDGTGQINFLVNLEDGYSIASIDIDGTYKNLKGPSDTGTENMYRITKIEGDLTITITTTQDPYTATFDVDEGVSSIDIYYTQDYETDSSVLADETDVTTAIARDGSTGAQDTSGSGQINFLVNLEENYLIDSITIEGNYKNLKDSADTGIENMYRITKITGDLTITITTKARTSIVPEITGYDAEYEYTGSSIEPEITVNIYGTETTLTEGTDYTISYGENTEVGTGTIYISSVSTSDYTFDDTYVNFSIVEKELTEDDVTVPTSITYTGSALSPEVVVYANGTTLVENTDYTVTYSNQNGVAGEYVTVIVEGKGNYTGTVTSYVLITPKASREVEMNDLTLVYGDTKVYTDTEDCEVTYTSSDETIVSVEHSYSQGTSTNTLTAVSVGEAVITVTYAETDDYAETTITFTVTVEQKELTITNVTVSDKEYDGTTDAEVTEVEFEGLLSTDSLTLGTDYSVEGEFSDASVEEDKTVSVTVTLSEETAANYTLATSTYSTTASITATKITSSDVSIESTSYTYDGTAKEPTIVVDIDGETLIQNTDYTVTYINNVDAGTATVTVEGIGNYSGTVTLTFTISEAEITPAVEDIEDVTYNATAQEPSVTVTYDGSILIENVDYTVTYTNNTNVGTATATISAVSSGNYSFEDITKTFNITVYTLTDSDVSLEYTTVRYDGTVKEPEVTVTINGITMYSSEYEVEYSDNTEIGTATVTITATGSNFTGTVEKTFSIVNKDVLTISGISDNQSIVYTGSEVVLEGTLTVSDNDNGITVDDLTVVWYDEDGNEISQPTDVGSYSVTYSYSDTDYEGSLTINFEITKATSGTPSEATDGLTSIEGQTLADVSLTTDGLYWVDETTEVVAGSNTYYATYTQNNDTKNYTTETVQITVYGKVYIDVITSVNGSGGSVSDSIENVLEGTTVEITFTPDDGYEIDNVTVNGTEVSVSDDTLSITAGTVDLEVIVTYALSSTDESTDDEETNDTTSNSSSEDEETDDDNSTNSTDSTTSTSSLPETGDTILKFVILFVISVVGILVSVKKIRDLE